MAVILCTISYFMQKTCYSVKFCKHAIEVIKTWLRRRHFLNHPCASGSQRNILHFLKSIQLFLVCSVACFYKYWLYEVKNWVSCQKTKEVCRIQFISQIREDLWIFSVEIKKNIIFTSYHSLVNPIGNTWQTGEW